jgi:hypothetical protein
MQPDDGAFNDPAGLAQVATVRSSAPVNLVPNAALFQRPPASAIIYRRHDQPEQTWIFSMAARACLELVATPSTNGNNWVTSCRLASVT